MNEKFFNLPEEKRQRILNGGCFPKTVIKKAL